jgi:hypothetical protein
LECGALAPLCYSVTSSPLSHGPIFRIVSALALPDELMHSKDIDIDDAGGLGHIFLVLRNHFTGNPTHPYNIHQILLMHQHLDPGYKFNLS